MATPYITDEEFMSLTVMPREDVYQLKVTEPSWLAAQILSFSAMIDGRLSKRYACPFVSPYPEVVRRWVVRLVTPHALMRRGVNALDQMYQAIQDDATKAWEEVTEAANAKEGLWELPLKETDSTNGITRSSTLAYSERDPYSWTDVQVQAVRG